MDGLGRFDVAQFKGVLMILATRLIASVRRAGLTRRGNISGQGQLITRAIDVLMAGV
jgi:toxin CcdB